MVVFLDTFAIIEIAKGNPNYNSYTLAPTAAITTFFNLVEVYFVYLKDYGQEEAERIYQDVRPLVVSVSDQIAKDAIKFKLANQKKRYSFADCIGYAVALKLEAKFVTGDYAFHDLENVEFIK